MDEELVQLTGGPSLAVRRATAPLRPFLLVHDVGADSGSWEQVASLLAQAGHEVAAVDLRGHGHSDVTESGYDTDTCADDLATLMDELSFSGSRSPIVVGHGWGANVVVSLAARRDGVAGVCCLNGGWTRPAWRYSSFEEFWAAAAPSGLAGSNAERWRSILHSLFMGEPRGWFPLVNVPVALCPLVPLDGVPDPSGGGTATRTGVAEAVARLPMARVSWYYGDDMLDQGARRITDDLLMLATDAEPQIN
jgi:pimeloyl-ACP methyl ester carboxylesterase